MEGATRLLFGELGGLLAVPPRGAPVGTTAASSQNFYNLSHGQQKLCLLARAMVKRPRLLLLDEARRLSRAPPPAAITCCAH